MISIQGEITTKALEIIANYLTDLEGDSAYILICSSGGDFEASVALFDLLRAYPGTVVTIAGGMVGSAALFIYLGGDERWALPHCAFYLHSPYFVHGKIDYNETPGTKKELDNFFDRINSIISKSTKMKKKDIEKYLKNGSIITKDEALEFGIAHKEVSRIPIEAFFEIEREEDDE